MNTFHLSTSWWRSLAIAGALAGLALHAPATLLDCTEAALVAAVSAGGTYTFTCDGVIVVSDTLMVTRDLTIDAGARHVTISGGDAVRVFNVNSGVRLTVRGIEISNGRAIEGAGILNDSGAVDLLDCMLANHVAQGTNGLAGMGGPGPGTGGAILNRAGTLNAVSCTFSNNQARGGKGAQAFFVSQCGGAASGGAISDQNGRIGLSNCWLVANMVQGGEGGDNPLSIPGCGGAGWGGAISSLDGAVTVVDTVLQSNSVSGGAGGNLFGAPQSGAGGPAAGGALHTSGGSLRVERSHFRRNRALGGLAGRGARGGLASGGGVSCGAGTASLMDGSFSENSAVAGFGRQDSGRSADGQGGALFNAGTITVERLLLSENGAFGSTASTRPLAGAGGWGNGGGIYNAGELRIEESALLNNLARGGAGAVKEGLFPSGFSSGGDGNGGALHNTNALRLINCTVAGNRAVGGQGATMMLPGGTSATGPGGSGFGGGLFDTGTATVAYATFSGNSGQGGAVHSSGQTMLHDSILTHSLDDGNCRGSVIDGGHNISSDASCAFSAPGSLNSTDPKLAPLSDYGGPTPTLALRSGSPALDAADNTTCPGTDQRGRARPSGAGCDIGAFESSPPYTIRGQVSGYLASPHSISLKADSQTSGLDERGQFIFNGLAEGTYQVTPTAGDAVFAPNQRLVSLGPDMVDLVFQSYRSNALSIERLTGDAARTIFAGHAGDVWQVLVSTNLPDWKPHSTRTVEANGLFEFTISNEPSSSPSFYRTVKP